MSKTIFILGASRGIGLGLVHRFLERGWSVIASERDRSEELHAVEGDARIVTCDVTDNGSIDALGLEKSELDALIVNAGIAGAEHQDAAKASRDEIAEVMDTNAFGPVRTARALLPAVKDGGTVGFMSSLMGSVADSSGGYDLYRTSKASLNMLAKGFAERHAASRSIATLSLHPGWVRTDMGGPNAKLTVEESTNGLADVIENASGGFRYVDYRGQDIPF